MKVAQKLYNGSGIIAEAGENIKCIGSTLVLGFGDKTILEQRDMYATIKDSYPTADIILCSTSGEIYDNEVFDNTVSVVAMEFEKTSLKTVTINIADVSGSYEAGNELFAQLFNEDLTYILIISDGGLVNGSELIRGIAQLNLTNIPVTGGLAGDADKFTYTLVGCNSVPAKGNIVAVGFYGDSLKIGHSSFGGWEILGPRKK